MGENMTQDQIQLPEPYGYVWFEEFEGGCFVHAYEVRPTRADSVFTATTVRRLIAEAVEKEREACAALGESRAGTVSMFATSKDARENHRSVNGCAAAIRA
jgi:hypothetical protein